MDDITKTLRIYAFSPLFSHGEYADAMRQAADEIDRLNSVIKQRHAEFGAAAMAEASAIAGRGAFAVALPATPEQAIAFLGSHFNIRNDAEDLSEVCFLLSVHDLLSAFSDLRESPAAPSVPAPAASGEFDDYPEYNTVAMGCGLEDRGITDRYDAMYYGWSQAIESMGERISNHLAASAPAAPAAPADLSETDQLCGAMYALRAIAGGIEDPAHVAETALKVIASIHAAPAPQPTAAVASSWNRDFAPMEVRETRVYLGRSGGFDVRHCPEPEALAQFIAASCNAAAVAQAVPAGYVEHIGYWDDQNKLFWKLSELAPDNQLALNGYLTKVYTIDPDAMLAAAPDAPAAEVAGELVKAADAVVERWHSKDWKQPHTGEFISRLAAAVGAAKNGASDQPSRTDAPAAPDVQPVASAPPKQLPEGWVPLNITFEGQYPEEVAYGPQRMMDRLKKWLDKYYAYVIAERSTPTLAAREAGAVVGWNDAIAEAAAILDGVNTHDNPMTAGDCADAIRALAAQPAAPAAQPFAASGAVPEYKLAEIQRMIARYGSLTHTHWPLAPMVALNEIMAAIKSLAAQPLAASAGAEPICSRDCKVECEYCRDMAAAPRQEAQPAVQADSMEDPILIQRGLIGAACYVLRKYPANDALLAKLRAFTFGRADDYRDCCDTPHLCSSVRRCTAKDSATPIGTIEVTQGGCNLNKGYFDVSGLAEGDHAVFAGAGTAAARDVLAERQRQISAEGWTPEHDDQYQGDELALAAICYAKVTGPGGSSPTEWPWPEDWWKPSDNRRNLVKAGALLIAEIERLDRAATPAAQGAETPKGGVL